MVYRQQTVGHGINVCLCVLCVSPVKLVIDPLPQRREGRQEPGNDIR